MIVELEGGWDNAVFDVDDTWIFRFPRRREVVGWLRMEAALLPELAPRLPVAVPQFEASLFDETTFVAYRKLRGEPLARGVDSDALGAAVGAVLASLHAFPVERARELVPRDSIAEQQAVLESFRARVLPLVDAGVRTSAAHLLDAAVSADFEPKLAHGDLGPAHILHAGDELTGVIDWSDARVGDPAIDFAWTLFGTGRRFATALAHAYGGIDKATRRRALVFHKLGPWHEVLYGLETDQPEFVVSGLAALEERVHVAEDRGD
jgi:aminoglycoside phosphotransferase (APT) family kinase protein